MRDDFDLAGRHVRVLFVGVAHDDLALDRDDPFGTQHLSQTVRLGVSLLVDDDLAHAGSIAEVDERQRAKVAAPVDPSHQDDLLAGVFGTKLAARVRALKLAEILNLLAVGTHCSL